MTNKHPVLTAIILIPLALIAAAAIAPLLMTGELNPMVSDRRYHEILPVMYLFDAVFGGLIAWIICR